VLMSLNLLHLLLGGGFEEKVELSKGDFCTYGRRWYLPITWGGSKKAFGLEMIIISSLNKKKLRGSRARKKGNNGQGSAFCAFLPGRNYLTSTLGGLKSLIQGEFNWERPAFN